MIKKITGYFLKGLLFLLPVLLLVYLVQIIVSLLVPFSVWGNELADLLLAILFIIVIGFLVSKGVGSYFKKVFFKTSKKVPIITEMVNAGKRLITVLKFSQEIFDKPVMITREQGKEIKFGFITGEMEEFGLKDHSSIYLPNPLSFLGEVVVVENKDIKPIKGEKEKVINFILSGGLISHYARDNSKH